MEKIKTHPQFPCPVDTNCTLWRYMDFTKFMSLLEDESLFMAKVDSLVDSYEGKVPRNYKLYIQENFGSIYDDLMPILESRRSFSYINCWHINEYESAAMWSLYMKSNEGIAIKTTLQDLSDSIDEKSGVWIGEVEYVDFDKHILTRNNIHEPIFIKRKSFEHEKELRVFYSEKLDPPFNRNKLPLYPNGFKVKVNLNKLIKGIYLAPNSPGWLSKLLEQIISRYGINAPIHKSEI